MSFWLHQHSSVRWLSTLPARSCYLAAGLISLFYLVIFSVYTVLPTHNQVIRVDRQIEALQAQAHAFEQVLDQQQQLSIEHSTLVTEKQAYASDVAMLQDTLNDLLLVMRDHKVSCRGITPLARQEEGLHEKHLVALKAKGSFTKLISLVHALEQPQYPITLRAVHLVKTRGNMVALDALVQIISVKEA